MFWKWSAVTLRPPRSSLQWNLTSPYNICPLFELTYHNLFPVDCVPLYSPFKGLSVIPCDTKHSRQNLSLKPDFMNQDSPNIEDDTVNYSSSSPSSHAHICCQLKLAWPVKWLLPWHWLWRRPGAWNSHKFCTGMGPEWICTFSYKQLISQPHPLPVPHSLTENGLPLSLLSMSYTWISFTGILVP